VNSSVSSFILSVLTDSRSFLNMWDGDNRDLNQWAEPRKKLFSPYIWQAPTLQVGHHFSYAEMQKCRRYVGQGGGTEMSRPPSD